MSDIVLVDLNERETWALLTTISYMQRAGYCLAPNLIEDYANNILENTSAIQAQSISQPGNSTHSNPALPSPYTSSTPLSNYQNQSQTQLFRRKVKPSFIENLLLQHPENNTFIPSVYTPPTSPTSSATPGIPTPAPSPSSRATNHLNSVYSSKQPILATSSMIPPTSRPATPLTPTYLHNTIDTDVTSLG